MAFTAGQKVRASQLNMDTLIYNPSVLVASITNTSFVGYRDTSSNLLGTAFVAPPSGKVLIGWGASLTSSTSSAEVQLSFTVGTGSTLGSGTSVLAAGIDHVVVTKTTTETTDYREYKLTGLTPGNTYNCAFSWKLTASGTASSQVPWMKIAQLLI